jgi:hypothetical protein
MKKPLKIAGAACLAVGLVSTWDTPANAQAYPSSPISFTGAITPSENLYDVYFLLAAGPCAPAYSKLIAGFVPANTTTTFDITINSIYSYDGVTPWVGNNFTVVGLYDTVNGGVSLGFDPAQAANILSTSPSPDFNGPWTVGYGPNGAYNSGGVQEPAVAGPLASGTYDGQSLNDSSSGGLEIDPNDGNYYSPISTDPNNPSDFTLVDFSGASPGGSGYAVEVVPEPSVVSFMALSLLSCGWLLRRRYAG